MKLTKVPGQVYEGTIEAKGIQIGIVCSRFNEFFVSKLLDGAVDTIIRHGGSSDQIDVAWVPGAYEIPLVVKKMVESNRYHAVIALGVVIQGATPHAALINNEVAKALAQISLESGVPVSYGMVNADNIEQAIERSGTKAGNKGADAASAAIEMANLIKNLPVRGGKNK